MYRILFCCLKIRRQTYHQVYGLIFFREVQVMKRKQYQRILNIQISYSPFFQVEDTQSQKFIVCYDRRLRLLAFYQFSSAWCIWEDHLLLNHRTLSQKRSDGLWISQSHSPDSLCSFWFRISTEQSLESWPQIRYCCRFHHNLERRSTTSWKACQPSCTCSSPPDQILPSVLLWTELLVYGFLGREHSDH